jgi:hypothetical protein
MGAIKKGTTMTLNALVLPDRHGRLPGMHYDALREPSPTTRADLIAWCIAQRDEHGVSVTLRGVIMMTMAAVMKNQTPSSRLDGLPAAMLGAIEIAADDLHTIVREFGYDPTGVEDFRTSCLAIIMERIAPFAYDLSPEGDPLADKPANPWRMLDDAGLIGVDCIVGTVQGRRDGGSTQVMDVETVPPATPGGPIVHHGDVPGEIRRISDCQMAIGAFSTDGHRVTDAKGRA